MDRHTSALIVLGLVLLSIADPRLGAAEPGKAATGSEALTLLPGDFTLTGPAAYQALIVERIDDGKSVGQVAEGLTFVSSDPKVVKIDAGVAYPVGNGQATVTARAGAAEAAARVRVVRIGEPHVWSFRNQVQPILAKAGCNGGACHGAFAGKKGFKLSLRGYDAMADYQFITRQARGRRVVVSDPGRSLILTKPTGAMPHKGGVRFAVGSPDYRIISEWIASGILAPREDDPRLERLEILPSAAVLTAGLQQQLIVRAHFSDGRSEDVTRWAKYTATNDSVAQVDQMGLVRVTGNGEGAINAWYSSFNAAATISVAYPSQVPAEVFAKAPRRNFIDELVLVKLESLNIPPSPPAGDAEFLRRAYIDTIGTLPSADETRKFLADTSPDKRDKLIEALLERPEFVDYWTYKWSDLLLVNSGKLSRPATWSYYNWIRTNVAANTPWDKLVRSLVTAVGSTLENGAANFFVLHQDPPKLAETVSMAFLGMSIGCAKCHNHPMEKWTNDQYYSMANLFSRVRVKERSGEGNKVVFAVHEGELLQPRTGKPQPPQPLDGTPVKFDDSTDRRIKLAQWLTAPENPYFSRAITNRIWANYFGVGLVENVDDLRLTNPPSNRELFSAAAQYLVDQRYDMKALMRVILQSQTYQRSSQSLPANAADQRFYSRYYPKRMMAEVLLDGISQVTAAPTTFAPRFAAGTRAIQLPDSNVDSYFLKSFGRPVREATCECERTAMPSMVQALHISNGETINQKLETQGNRLDQLLTSGAKYDQIVEEAYLSALARYPSATEKSQLVAVLASAPAAEKRLVLEDMYWGVLSSKEFLFNH